ncbi:MAG TPA: RNA polymerase sigma-70 factor [Gemmatimonadales bacterium]|jgi:RNA polymerase sigma-70 factor (ECF subfamily)
MSLEIRLANQLLPPLSSGEDTRTDADERAWVDRIRAGDLDAFEALYRRYWERLFAFAFRYLRSKEDAEEITQEVFFRIWRGREHWVPAGAVRNYLYLAVRNSARDRLERAAVARRWRIGQPTTAAKIQSNLEAADLVAAVERALAELPAKRAEVCKLRLINELSYAQIAQRLGICEKTVETQLARGLKFLRDRMRSWAHPGLAPGVRISAPAEGSAAKTLSLPEAPRGA